MSDLAVVVTNGQFVLNWSNVANNTGYVLQYANGSVLHQAFNDGELGWTNVSPNPANATSATLNAPLSNTLYYFRLYPVDAGGTGTCSNVVSGHGVSSAPAGVTAERASGDTQIATVNWLDIVALEKPVTTFSTSADGVNWNTGGSVGGNITTYTVTGLAVDTVYQFRVQAIGPGSTGGWSLPATARTLSTLAGQIAYDGFSDSVGGGVDLNGQTGGIGWTSGWNDSNTTQSGINSGSLALAVPAAMRLPKPATPRGSMKEPPPPAASITPLARTARASGSPS